MKVITASMARALAGQMKNEKLIQEIMNSILLESMKGSHSIIISRNGVSTEDWEKIQVWLIGLDYLIDASSKSIIVRW